MSKCTSTLKETNIFNNPNPMSLVGLKSVNTKVIQDTVISHPTRIVAASQRRLDSPLQEGPRELHSWLDGFFALQVPACPMTLLIQKSIGSRIEERARDVQYVLSKALRDDLDIKKELYALRAVFLGGAGDAATHFFTNIFDILDDPAKIDAKWNTTTLNELLIDAFTIDNSGEFPEERGIQVEIIPEAEQNLFSHAVIGTGSLEKIASLRYSFDIKWPHNIVIPPSAMSQYNAVAVFLGQLRRAHAAMQSVTTARWSERIRRDTRQRFRRFRGAAPRASIATFRGFTQNSRRDADFEHRLARVDEENRRRFDARRHARGARRVPLTTPRRGVWYHPIPRGL